MPKNWKFWFMFSVNSCRWGWKWYKPAYLLSNRWRYLFYFVVCLQAFAWRKHITPFFHKLTHFPEVLKTYLWCPLVQEKTQRCCIIYSSVQSIRLSGMKLAESLYSTPLFCQGLFYLRSILQVSSYNKRKFGHKLYLLTLEKSKTKWKYNSELIFLWATCFN